jgi:dihydrofolate reductase
MKEKKERNKYGKSNFRYINVDVIGGANVARQCMSAGLLDEIRLHLVHVLLGSGVRLFDNMSEQTKLQKMKVIDSFGVTHFTFRPVKQNT